MKQKQAANPYAHVHTFTLDGSTFTRTVYAVPPAEVLDAEKAALQAERPGLDIGYRVQVGGMTIAYPVGVTWYAGATIADSAGQLREALKT